jgi:hypothetical protein
MGTHSAFDDSIEGLGGNIVNVYPKPYSLQGNPHFLVGCPYTDFVVCAAY